ncbi:MAG: hypothetical protein DMG43_12465 [Acidobacteria bacterium]|nr:MAG: hypothetical protein DMG43_12465 [Acidobacteriota bacterium]
MAYDSPLKSLSREAEGRYQRGVTLGKSEAWADGKLTTKMKEGAPGDRNALLGLTLRASW